MTLCFRRSISKACCPDRLGIPLFGIASENTERLSRASRRRGVKLHLLDLGGDIAGNGISKLFLTIAAAFAEAERDRIRERIGQVV